mmetsp:Transcript_40253/g.85854  ORF Transcript_40253/g.85854 Transcript_40253/m.85854 type:complete len:444 (+) Transcript_40253:83-1414(+)
MTAMAQVLIGLCRSSYYISLLGLKIPAGLLVLASRAKHVLAFISLVWVPFLVCCHVSLLPWMQRSSRAGTGGMWIWQVLMAIWVTIPLCVVGSVVLSKLSSPGPFMAFACALTSMVCVHWALIPLVAPTQLGSVLLQALFTFFEDCPIVAWIWCLVHVVRVQEHVRKQQAGRTPPFAAPQGPEDRVLIVGNAPTVTDGPPLGHKIDGFNHVVRFNSYSIDRPAHTGTKVGFHFSNGRNFPEVKSVKAVCPLFNASLTHAVYLFMPHMEDAADIYAALTSSKVDSWFIEEDRILELRKKIGCRVWQIPTSGMVAIDAFLSRREKVTLHGFNFFAGKKIHYFEESPTQLITNWLERFVTHDPSREKIWVKGLIESGRASFLAQDVADESSPTACNDDEDLKAASPVSEAKFEEKKLEDEDGEMRRRTPGIVQTLLKDGFPSQFSL